MITKRLNESIEIVCESAGTRNGFKHTAVLIKNGLEYDRAKCCYINRTWESYRYRTVMQKLVENTKYLTPEQKTEFLKLI